MPGQRYIDQSMMDLKLNLFEGKLPRDQLNIFVSDTYKTEYIHIEAGIIGASHFISSVSNEGCISEVFACHTIETKIPVFHGSLKDLHGDVSHILHGGMTYFFKSEILKLNEKNAVEKLTWIRDRAMQANNIPTELGMRHQFTSPNGAPPETILWLSATSTTEVKVITAHSYPNEGNVVLTTSEIKVNVN